VVAITIQLRNTKQREGMFSLCIFDAMSDGWIQQNRIRSCAKFSHRKSPSPR